MPHIGEGEYWPVAAEPGWVVVVGAVEWEEVEGLEEARREMDALQVNEDGEGEVLAVRSKLAKVYGEDEEAWPGV